MTSTISIDQLADTITANLAEYTDEVAEQVREEVSSVSKETVSELKSSSPQKTGVYANGWTKKVTTDKTGRYVIRIYNKSKPSLTHLLEYGHAKPKGGNVPAKPHIQPAAEKATQKLTGKVKLILR